MTRHYRSLAIQARSVLLWGMLFFLISGVALVALLSDV